ncbi:MAG TPA: hypothetical protein VNQ76_04670 [Planctomicrobium sp.]|nr:hypothetical protein [Planctomicrobium sp.]
MSLITALWNDNTGFIVSAELVLVATIAVLGLIVGFSQVQNAVVSELNDVGHAIGSLNQSYYYSGFSARKWGGWLKSRTFGSFYYDGLDACDGLGCAIACECAVPECGQCGIAGGFGTTGFSGGAVTGTTERAICQPVITEQGRIVEPTCAGGLVVPDQVIQQNGYIPVAPQQIIPPAPTGDNVP